MRFAFRKTLLILMLAVTALVVTKSYAQPSDDACECCVAAHEMMCAMCKVCASPALFSQPAAFAFVARSVEATTIRRLNPSTHTEDIWHPPKP